MAPPHGTSTRPGVRTPAPPAALVERPRLLEAVTRAVNEATVTLVCAPAGSGKTVLVSGWATATALPVLAWMTASPRDNAPRAFWWHVRSVLSDAGALRPGEAGGLFPGADDVELLSHQLRHADKPVALVLDAIDRIDQREVFDGLAALVDGTDGLLRVVMTSRRRPPLPLHRYRLEGALAELGREDLAFTGTEVSALLEAHGVTPTDEAVEEVFGRTEGWAAGATMAGLALRPDGDGADLGRLAADYLSAEVLDPLPDVERELLLRVGILDEVSPGLAAALSEDREAEGILEGLSQRNAFVEPIRGRPGSFRIHPLLRELLVARGGSRVDELHRSAADWYGTDGQLLQAVDQAVAAGDWERASAWTVRLRGIVDLLAPEPGNADLAQRLAGLPSDGGAHAGLVRAALALARGDTGQAAEQLAAGPSPGDEPWAAVLTACLGERTGDVELTLEAAEIARRSLTGGDPEDATVRALVSYAEGTVYLQAGELDRVVAVLEGALPAATAGGRHHLTIACLSLLALAESCRGRLSRAEERADAADRIVEDVSATRPAALDLARAWVALDRQNLPGAAQALARAGLAVDPADPPLLRWISLLLRARLKRDHGDSVAARRLLQDADSRVGWLRPAFDEEAAPVGLLALVAGLEPAGPSSAGASLSREVHALLEDARIQALEGDSRGGRSAVERALSLARTERVRRPFAHAAPEIRAMIRTDRELRSRANWLRPEHATADERDGRMQRAPVVEELSERELEVLRHLSALLTTEEIAAEMFISANTVRTHIRRILGKLSVSRRHEAVRRARELDLV